MNTLYLILIVLGFSAGVLTSTLKSDKVQATNICIEEKTECSSADEILLEPETKAQNLYLINE